MNQSRLHELSEVTTLDDLRQAFILAGHDLGFGIFSLALVQPEAHRGEFGLSSSIYAMPEPWLEHAKDPDTALKDPVFTRLLETREPFFYDQEFYASAGRGPMWESSAPFGIAAGVAATLHISGGRRIIWGFDGHSLPRSESERTHLLATTQLLGVFAAGAVERLMSKQPKLFSESQLAVLKYTREGYPAWKIAHFLGITEDTVNYHFKQCRAKLSVANKHQAVQKAIELGLLV